MKGIAAKFVSQELTDDKKNIEMKHLLHLFPRMKLSMKGYWYDCVEEVEKKAKKGLLAFSQNDWKKCFEQ